MLERFTKNHLEGTCLRQLKLKVTIVRNNQDIKGK
jgi:hypothetical protein